MQYFMGNKKEQVYTLRPLKKTWCVIKYLRTPLHYPLLYNEISVHKDL